MGGLREMFGPNREQVWRQLAQEIGATYDDGGFWHGDKIEAKVKAWTVTLDTYTVSTGKSSATFTRMRAPYVNPDGFRFKIYRKGLFSALAKKLGMQDIEVGEREFDDAFIVQGNEEAKVLSLLAAPKLRQMMLAMPEFYLEVKDSEGVFGPKFPKDVDELYFQVGGVIRDLAVLKGLFGLFAEVLNTLCHIGSAYENDPQLTL
ncbi:MAG: DUF3137 domain-containing protein [Acidobacteria bacterium 21-70-11]|nr:MAG: DUF3137 domain-containing protein [Acidobacteria bacterium 21-70-11]OYW04953.1 MAG: DUF3137 domain-containing protein [Acidobacteria bacterium 37-71-11]HQT94341.1 hypothetical protein [Thermoanaerobaculaceae bacterium]HQU33213.1 hypothetical protein [Thermoanaerobaculaceae bacterium]